MKLLMLLSVFVATGCALDCNELFKELGEMQIVFQKAAPNSDGIVGNALGRDVDTKNCGTCGTLQDIEKSIECIAKGACDYLRDTLLRKYNLTYTLNDKKIQSHRNPNHHYVGKFRGVEYCPDSYKNAERVA